MYPVDAEDLTAPRAATYREGLPSDRMAPSGNPAPRVRNRRGEGNRLRDEIVEAAAAMIEEAGEEEVVTLRAVARRIGIAAPSIYSHFADRDAIIEAVAERGFSRLIESLNAAISVESDPVACLYAGCRAYLRFAAERPSEYRTMFQRSREPAGDSITSAECASALPTGLEAFDVLVEGVKGCAEAGMSNAVDPYLDAVAIWVALHGLATLMAVNSGFPWPDPEALLSALIGRLARLSGTAESRVET